MKSTWNWMYYCKWADPRSAPPCLIHYYVFAPIALNYVSVLCDCIACIAVVVVAVADDLPHVPACLQYGGWMDQVTADTSLTWVSHSCCFRLTWRVEQPWDSSRFLSTSYLANSHVHIYRICICSVFIHLLASTWCSRTSSPAPSRSQCSATTCWSQSSTSEADLVLSSSLLWCRQSLDSLSR